MLLKILISLPIVGHYHNRPAITVPSSVAWSKTPDLPDFNLVRHISTDINISGFVSHITTSGYRPLLQSLGKVLSSSPLSTITVYSQSIAVGILMISVILSDIYVLPVLVAILLFPVFVNVTFICGHFLLASCGRKRCFYH